MSVSSFVRDAYAADAALHRALARAALERTLAPRAVKAHEVRKQLLAGMEARANASTSAWATGASAWAGIVHAVDVLSRRRPDEIRDGLDLLARLSKGGHTLGLRDMTKMQNFP
jgi:hypothetical protein